MYKKLLIAITLLLPSTLLANNSPGWIVGAGADYLLDNEEVFYNGHIGFDYGGGSSVYLETGAIDFDESLTVLGTTITAELDIIPVTLNYKYEWSFTPSFGMYVGAGIGAAKFDAEVNVLGVSIKDDSWVVIGQVFAGFVVNASDCFEIYVGARYIVADDSDFLVGSVDDTTVGAGIRYHF